MDHERHHGAAGRWVTAQFVGDQSSRDTALFFQQLPEEAEGGLPVAPRLHENVDRVAVFVDGTPQILQPPPAANVPRMCILEPRDRLAHRGPSLQRLLEAVVAAPIARTDIPWEMLWFVDERGDRSQRIGLRCYQENGTYVVTVVEPDGSESQTTFDNEDSMTAEAVRIHLGLEHRGWRALPRTE